MRKQKMYIIYVYTILEDVFIKMKKALSVFLVLVMVITAFPLTALNTYADIQGDYGYTVLSDGTIRIDHYYGVEENLTIPSSINGYTVTEIGYSAFKNCQLISTLTLPNTLVYIDNSAFYGCINLRNLVLPEGITALGDQAFYGCTSLESVTVPTSLRSFGSNSFYGDEAIESVYISDLSLWASSTFNNYGPLYYGADLYVNGELLETLVVDDSFTTINQYSFAGCGSLKRVVIQYSLPYDNFKANRIFSSCENLTEFSVDPDISTYKAVDGVLYKQLRLQFNYSGYNNYELCCYPCGKTDEEYITPTVNFNIKEIATYAFYQNSHLKKATFANGLEKIYYGAFQNSKLLQEVIIPDSVTYIDMHVFANCKNLSKVVLGSGITIIDRDVFSGCESLSDINLPNTLTKIEQDAFYKCKSLTEISFGPNMKTICSSAFNTCTSLETVTFNDGLERIESSAFASCETLKSVDVPDSVTFLGGNVFQSCTSLESANIGTGISYIPGALFSGCHNLETVYFASDYTSVGGGAFNECYSLKTINWSDSITEIGYAAFMSCRSLENVVLPQTLTTIGKYAFYRCATITDVEIPAGVTIIPENAFYGCSSLEHVQIPDTLQSIGDLSFDYCSSLQEFNIPASVTYTYTSFEHTNSLTGFYVDENNPNYSSEDGVLFNKDKTVLYNYPSGNSRTEYTVPDTVVELSVGSFFETHELQTLTILDNVTVIPENNYHNGYSSAHSTRIIEPGHDTPRSNKLLVRGYPDSEAETLANRNTASMEFFYIHFFDNWTFTVEPTCTTDGHGYRTCSECGYVQERDFPAFGHEYATTWTTDIEPTCTEPGEKSFHCSRCNDRIEITSIPATGHNYAEAWTVDVPATCTEPGIKSHHCLNCGARTEETQIPYKGHTYGLWTVETQPSCTSDGEKVRHCISCDVEQRETVPAYGHDFEVSYTIDTEATCDHDGEKSRHCSRCDARTDITSIPGGNHFYGAWTMETEPTCTEAGEAVRTCEICGVQEHQVMPALGHDYLSTWTVDTPATCTESGIKSHHCSRCDSRKDITRINATGHSYGNWIIDNEANCVHEGAKHRVCESCGNVDSMNIPATGHTYSTQWKIDIEPKCISEGEKSHHCLQCDARTDITVIPVSGHIFGQWYIETEATADAEGVKAHKCINCELIEREAMPKLAKYKATFVADGEVVAVVDFPEGATEIEEPEVPYKSKYEGAWEYYELHDRSITINAEYVKISSDNINEVETDNETGYYSSTAEVEIAIKATSPSRNIVSTTVTSVPLDIVLVLDQSGSMEGTKKDALVSAVQSFSDTVLNDAKENNVNHRIAIVGFSMGNKGAQSGNEYIPAYYNTNILTTGSAPVQYNNATSADYANALVYVNDNGSLNSAIATAITKIDAKGATMANYGLEMAGQIFANNDSAGRQRVVVFLTDGEPTSTNTFDYDVANTALHNAYQLKDTYKANIYSVGIFDNSTANDRNVNNFMNYVSSNYTDKHTLNKYRTETTPAPQGFYLSVGDISELSDIFINIAEDSVITTAMFDNLSFVYTLSDNFSLTSGQEESLRQSITAKYGITNNDITVERNTNGTTKIKVAHITPTYTEGKYLAELTFRASANENTRTSGTYAVNTLDSGILIDNATEYEEVFSASSVDISGTSGIAVFNINGVPYEIDRLKSTDYVIAPDTNFPDDLIFSGWDIPADTKLKNQVAIYDATLTNSEYNIKWNIDGDVTTVSCRVGDVIQIPNVGVNSIGEDFTGWDTPVPYTMPAQDLEFNAQYGVHYHNYTAVTDFTDCTQGGTITYTCECGDTYTETIAPHSHSFAAISGIASDENSSQVAFRCTECGLEAENVLDYQQTGTLADGSGNAREATYDFSYVDENGNPYQPDDDVNISVAVDDVLGDSLIDGTSVAVYRVNDDGSLTPIYSENDGAYVTFTTDHFSTYVFRVVGGRNEMCCDINGDGILNSNDYSALVAYIQGESALNKTELLAADIDDDGSVDGLDAVYLKLYLNSVVALP